MDLKKIPFGTKEAFNVLIEISKGSPNKYEYEEASQEIKLDYVFSDGFTFAYNYGLIPGTKAPDGDHLDVLVLSDEILPPGVVLLCRAIGMIELVDRGEVDNKIIAVQIADEKSNNLQSIKDLPENWCAEARAFFMGVAKQKKKIIEIKGFRDKARALEELDNCKL